MFKSLTLAGFAVLASMSFAHAADTAVKPVAMPAPVKAAVAKPRAPGSCTPIMDACKNAGFSRGKHTDGKGLIGDCVKPLTAGKTVAGVSVDKASIDACNTAHAERKAKFDAKMKNDPEFAKKVEARKAAWAAKRQQGVANKAAEKMAQPIKAPDAAK